ncbi:MAG: secondary thiamine-phosphate synthase enzyme [Gammaproteobacteria bacterium]
MTQQVLRYQTAGRELIDISDDVLSVVKISATAKLCNVFVPHTSASLILNENWDPDVQTDLQSFFRRLVPDGDSLFVHDSEGPDDMPGHIRTALTQSSISIPIVNGKLGLGTWQGIFLWEHRTAAHERKVIVSCI